MDLPGGKAGNRMVGFVHTAAAEGMELWVLLIFCNIGTFLITHVRSELPLVLLCHQFLFPARIVSSITDLGEVLLSSCYMLSLALGT